MADGNRYRRRDFNDDYDRNNRGDRQPEQFQSDRPCYGDDYDTGYGQMGDDYGAGRGQYAGRYDEENDGGRGYGDVRGGRSGWSGSRDRSYASEPGGTFGASRIDNRERQEFGSFNSESYRTAGGVGPRENLGYGRGSSMQRGAYSSGSYGAGSYGAAPRRDYGGQDDRGFFDRAGDELASWFGDDEAARRREMDHRGRGPANYNRSDERILEDACDALTEDWGVDARNIQVTVENGEVTLDGTVENRRQKRRAEDCVHDVSGVGHVQNNLRTQDTARRDEDATNTSERNTGTLS